MGWFSLGYKDNKFGKTTFCCSLDTIETESPNSHGYYSSSEVSINTPLNHSIWSNSLLKKQSAVSSEKTRAASASNEKTNQIPHCEKTHSHGKSCPNPAIVQPPSDQRKQARIEKTTVPSERSTSTKTTTSHFFQVKLRRRELIAGGTSDRRGRQACFLSAVDPLEEPLPDSKEFSHKETLNDAPRTFKKDQILMECTHLT